jgi:anti-anti-sigma regulatory factor
LQSEIAERRLTEVALHEREELVRLQAATLSEVSIILLPISDRALVMPLIGALDSERAQRLTAALLAGVTTSQARVVILDITGIPMLDAQAATVLIDAARGVRLLGAEAVITGIRAEVARKLVELQVDLSGIATHSSLQSGIAYALSETSTKP